jgi:predicted PurR-regulated permease PerM
MLQSVEHTVGDSIFRISKARCMSFTKHRTVQHERKVLLTLALTATVALGMILFPFYGVVLWAAVTGMVFAPLHRLLLRYTGKRHAVAALTTLMVVLLIVVLPMVFLAAAMAGEAATVYQRLQSGEWNATLYLRDVFDTLPGWFRRLLEAIGLPNFNSLQRKVTVVMSQGSQFIATQALSLGQNTFEFVASLFVTLYLAFFFIRDGSSMVQLLRNALPLTAPHKVELFDQFTVVIRATVKGTLLVAAIQGALGGIAFWFLGVSGALLWAVLMAFLALLPLIGSALVWVPVAAYFLLIGALWQSLALTLWGVLVMGLIDNVLRPILVGRDAHLPDYIVMIATVGGLSVFGINGFVLGPVIAAMFFSVWTIYLRDHSTT